MSDSFLLTYHPSDFNCSFTFLIESQTYCSQLIPQHYPPDLELNFCILAPRYTEGGPAHPGLILNVFPIISIFVLGSM